MHTAALTSLFIALIIQALCCDATICRTHHHLNAECTFIVMEIMYASNFWLHT